MKRILALLVSFSLVVVAALLFTAAQSSMSGGGVNTAAAVVALFTGCSGTLYLGADGACHTAGAGTVTSGDGTVENTSPTAGALTLANAAADTVLANSTGSAAAPIYVTGLVLGLANSTAGTLQLNSSSSATNAYKLSDASGLQTLGTNEPLVLAPNGTGYVQVNQAGTNAAPSLVLTDTTTGFYRTGSGAWGFSSAGTAEIRMNASGLNVGSGNVFGMSSGAATTANDTGVSRGGASGLIDVGTGAAGNAAGFVKTAQTLQVITADVTCGTSGTLTPCTSLTTITGLSLALPLVAANWSFDCDIVMSQATSAAADQFGVQTATNGATNLTASAIGYTAAAVSTSAAITDVSSTTTAQSVITLTPGTTGAKLPVHLSGTVEGASASGTTLNIMVLTGAAADLVTIYRGSKCWVH